MCKGICDKNRVRGEINRYKILSIEINGKGKWLSKEEERFVEGNIKEK